MTQRLMRRAEAHVPAARPKRTESTGNRPIAPLSPRVVLDLQQAIGNKQVQRMIKNLHQTPLAVQRAVGAALTADQVRRALAYNGGRGLNAPALRQVQQTIGAGADGALNEGLVQAVAAWQDRNGLTPDGKLGPKTMGKIAEQAGITEKPAETPALGPQPSAGPTQDAGPIAAEPAPAAGPGMLATIGQVASDGLTALKNFVFGPGTGTEAVPGEPAKDEPSANDQAKGAANPLDELMAKERLSTAEIRQARELIDAESDETRRAELFQALQAKVEYHSQRDNESTQGGKKIGDVMCNLTSLAMAMTYLGVENPEPTKQFEDVLEQIRVEKKLPARTLATGWGGVAAEFGVKVEFIDYNVVQNHDWYKAKVAPALAAGEAVMASITGHIVRLQAVTPEGLVADDPFGNVKLTKGSGHEWDETNKNGKNAGEDSVWPWSEVSIHNMLWIARLRR